MRKSLVLLALKSKCGQRPKLPACKWFRHQEALPAAPGTALAEGPVPAPLRRSPGSRFLPSTSPFASSHVRSHPWLHLPIEQAVSLVMKRGTHGPRPRNRALCSRSPQGSALAKTHQGGGLGRVWAGWGWRTQFLKSGEVTDVSRTQFPRVCIRETMASLS